MSFGFEGQIKELRNAQDQMQTKTFTKWWNSYLRERGTKLESLHNDIQDGVQLVNLIEVISGEFIGRYNKVPKHKMHRLENQKAAIEFLNKKNISTLGIGPEDLVAGNHKLVLALSWILILRYEVQKYGADTNELLKWARDRTLGYPRVEVRNFKESFNDGLAFCALIHKHYPDKLDYDTLNKDDDRANLATAFNVAEKEFGVPQLLEVQDMASGKPDEKSVITYVAKLRQAFADKTKMMEDAARLAELERIKAEEEEHARITDEIVADYNDRSEVLHAWIRESDEDFVDKNVREDYGATPEESQEKLDDLNTTFRGLEKPPRKQEKEALTTMHREIEQRVRGAKENRPSFAMPATPSDTDQLWTGMVANEAEYERGLKNRRQELEDARNLAAAAHERRDKAYDDLERLLPAFADRHLYEDETDRLKAEYDNHASDLAEWIAQKKNAFDDQVAGQDFGSSPEETREKLSDLVYGHRQEEKPPKHVELMEMDVLHRTIEARRQTERRPPFTYAIDADQLDKDFREMEQSEQALHDELVKHLRHTEAMLPLLARFRRIAARLELWWEGVAHACASDFAGKDMVTLTDFLHSAALMTSELRGHDASRRNLKAQGALLAKHEDFHAEVTETCDKIVDLFTPLQQQITDHQKALRLEIERRKKIELAQVENEKQVLMVSGLIEQAQDIVQIPLDSDSASSIAVLVDAGNKAADKLRQPVIDGVDNTAGLSKADEWNQVAELLEARAGQLKTKGAAGALDQKQRVHQQAVKHFEDTHARYVAKLATNHQVAVRDMERILKTCDNAVTDCQARADTARGLHDDMMDMAVQSDEETVRSHIVTPAVMEAKVQHVGRLLDALGTAALKTPPEVDAKSVQNALAVLVDADTGAIDESDLRARIGADKVETLAMTLPVLDESMVATFDPFPHATSGAPAVTSEARRPSRGPGSTVPVGRTPTNASGATPTRGHAPPSSTVREGADSGRAPVTAVPVPVSVVGNKRDNTLLPVVTSGSPPSDMIPDGKGGHTKGQQSKVQIEDGVNLYTTQSTSSPVFIMFDLEVHKKARIEFVLSLEGSTNIEFIEPYVESLETGREITAFTTARIAIIAQKDPYEATELKMKYSTRLLRE